MKRYREKSLSGISISVKIGILLTQVSETARYLDNLRHGIVAVSKKSQFLAYYPVQSCAYVRQIEVSIGNFISIGLLLIRFSYD